MALYAVALSPADPCETMRESEFARPVRRHRRRPPAEQADLEPRPARPHNRRAVANVERLRVFARRGHRDGAVREHAVHVKQEQPEALGAHAKIVGGNGHEAGDQIIWVRQRS